MASEITLKNVGKIHQYDQSTIKQQSVNHVHISQNAYVLLHNVTLEYIALL